MYSSPRVAQRVAITASIPSRSANGVTSAAGLVVAIAIVRPAARCSSMTPAAYGCRLAISSSAAASAAWRTSASDHPAVARAAELGSGRGERRLAEPRYDAATAPAPGMRRWLIPAASRLCENTGADGPPISVRSRSKIAAADGALVLRRVLISSSVLSAGRCRV